MRQKKPSELFDILKERRLAIAGNILPGEGEDTSRVAIEMAYPLLIRQTPVMIVGGLLSDRELLSQILATELKSTPDKLQEYLYRYTRRAESVKAIDRVFNMPLVMMEPGPLTVESILDTALPIDGGRKAKIIFIDLNLYEDDRNGLDELFEPERTDELFTQLGKVAVKEGIRIHVIRPGTIDAKVGPKARAFQPLDPYPTINFSFPSSTNPEPLPKWREFARRAFYRELGTAMRHRASNPFVTLCDEGNYLPHQMKDFRKLLDQEFGAWMEAQGMSGSWDEDGGQTTCDCFDPIPTLTTLSFLDDISTPCDVNV